MNLIDLKKTINKIKQEIWPINWANFQKLDLVYNSILQAPNSLKAILIVLVLISTLSFGTLASGLYTKVLQGPLGGMSEFKEAIINENTLSVNKFNPVLEDSNEIEKKVNTLLFHPLYYVKYPNLLTDKSANPEIIPVLLASAPEWKNGTTPNDQFRTLYFKLKSDIKWSNGKAITSEDMEYTFRRLQEEGGDANFRDTFINYEFLTISPAEFQIVAKNSQIKANPQLIYQANFTPISKDFFENQTNSNLAQSPRSKIPTVSSGFFSFPEKTDDPYTDTKDMQSNPFNKNTGSTVIVLEKNKNQNHTEPAIQKYILKLYDTVEDSGGIDKDSLEKDAKNGQVDLLNQAFSDSTMNKLSQTLTKYNFKTKNINTNTYYNIYLNLQLSNRNYFINQVLRKYVACGLVNWQFPDISTNLKPIDSALRLVPLQLPNRDSNCTSSKEELVNLLTERKKNIYLLEQNPSTNLPQVYLYDKNTPIRLNLAGMAVDKPILDEIQKQLQSLGFPTDVNLIKDSTALNNLLISKTKNYNLILLPFTILTRDLYPIYGLGGKNVSSITSNNRIGKKETKFGEGVEQQLKTYSQSNLQDKNLENELADIFQTQAVSVNLLNRSGTIFYPDKNVNLENNLPTSFTFNDEVYTQLPKWR